MISKSNTQNQLAVQRAWRWRAASSVAWLALLTGCVSDGGSPPAAELSLVCEQPMPVVDFLKYAQRQTGRVYLLRAKVAPDARIAWVGTLHLDGDDFESFVETMLWTAGLVAIPRLQGEVPYVEVCAAGAR
jgi:hypothetical protein